MIDQIEAARFYEDPWPHLEFEEFFSPDDAERISSEWPADGYKWLRHSDIMKDDGTSLRKYQPLAARFPDISARLMSDEIADAFRVRLDVLDGELYPKLLLVEDLPGYRIRRHTDCAGKVISAQVYFPDAGAPEAQGVNLEGKQIPYRFNHGYAFKVTDRSWHRVHKSETRRRSVQLIYYNVPNPKV